MKKTCDPQEDLSQDIASYENNDCPLTISISNGTATITPKNARIWSVEDAIHIELTLKRLINETRISEGICIDLHEVIHIGNGIIEKLILAKRDTQKAGKSFCLTNIRKEVQKTIQKFNGVLPIK